ncbi:hypothetical protein OS493_037493 [Desmophyllum pertusum]|uniref:Uncharacterized protein n=1 Tax=Desmophyllum pertusum TaxID=174260 RepID=A0A9X0CNA9_9CNID|nr:hypothetical protein OS493_037493 [Desmophyllum pertusum]
MSMVKAVNTEAPIWYAQDAAGGIWKLDLSFTHTVSIIFGVLLLLTIYNWKLQA